MKKTIIATLAAGALLLTAACGSSDTSSDELVEVDEVEVVEETTEPATDTSSESAEPDQAMADAQDQLADDMAVSESLTESMTSAGIDDNGQIEIDIWASMMCEFDAHAGRTDAEMVGHLREDNEAAADLSDSDAAAIWRAVKESC